jgi:hypothetical protein
MPNLSVGLASNPLKPGQWSRPLRTRSNIDFEWFAAAAMDSPTAQERQNDLVAYGMAAGQEKELYRMAMEAVERLGLVEGAPVPAELIYYLSKHVSSWALGVLQKQPLTAAELKARDRSDQNDS